MPYKAMGSFYIQPNGTNGSLYSAQTHYLNDSYRKSTLLLTEALRLMQINDLKKIQNHYKQTIMNGSNI